MVANRVEFLGVRLQALPELRCILEEVLAQPEQPAQWPVIAGVEFRSKAPLSLLAGVPERTEADLSFGDAEGVLV
ncbi:MAG: hypothetical protein JWO38_2145 [Gemmataceae bacterium]|nr:hypothetical protein [Gemmataceae bacterium]